MPTLTLIAGPNGSGKSTLTRSIDFDGRERLLDPDAIARELNPLDVSAAAITAAREVLRRTAEYFNPGLSFAVETTLSGKGRLDLIREAKSRGDTVNLIFVGVNNPELCITRIRRRASQGGHSVPDVDARRRYARSVANAAQALRQVYFAKFYDNSGEGHRLILIAEDGVIVWQLDPLPDWLNL